MIPGILYNLNRVKFAFLSKTIFIELQRNLRLFPPTLITCALPQYCKIGPNPR